MSKFKMDEHKLMYHPERVAQWLENPRETLSALYVEISPVGYCNHRCTFCALDYLEYERNKLDTQVLKDALVNMKAHGVKSVMFAGEGEPLLHGDIAELICFAKANGLDVALTTNATALSLHFCEKALSSCTWIKVSCNAGDAPTYAKVHGCDPNHWNLLWKNIAGAVAIRNELKANTTIGVQSVLLPDNASTMNSLAKQSKQAGVDYLVVKPYSQHKSSLNTQYAGIVYDEIYDKYLDALHMYASSNFEIVARRQSMKDYGSEVRGYDKCLSVPYFWAYLMADGSLYGCSAFLGDSRFCYGNIYSKSFSRLWLGKVRKNAISHMNNYMDVSECRKNCRMQKINCYLWDIKNGGEHRNFI